MRKVDRKANRNTLRRKLAGKNTSVAAFRQIMKANPGVSTEILLQTAP